MKQLYLFILTLATGVPGFCQPPVPPVLQKAFGAVSIGAGETTTLTFRLSNPNPAQAFSGLDFSDFLPFGLVVATPNGLQGSCPSGTITAVAGSASITLTGATLAADTDCTFRVNVTTTGDQLGLLFNTTTVVTVGGEQPSGDPASDVLFVGNPFQVSYFSNLNLGDSVINITNTGREILVPQGASVGILADAGAIDVNVYVFSPDEQMISCCCCPVTTNGLVSLSVKQDLISNPLTPAVPTSVVVKLVASTPVAGACSTPAPVISQATLTNGLAAWGTSLHVFAGTVGGTETPFSGATLSAGELVRLRSLCTFINANGSGFGICRSCRLGGLGATGR